MKHYVLILDGGTEMSRSGPFDTPEERLTEAKKIWSEMGDGQLGNVFWADVSVGLIYGDPPNLSVGAFADADFYE